MALQLETIRATADRIAASHHLDVVDLEFTGGAKHRALRVFLEKDSETREKIAAAARAEEVRLAAAQNGAQDIDNNGTPNADSDAQPEDLPNGEASSPEPEEFAALPSGVPVEQLSGVTHEDCANFARDFGAVLDIEDLIPGAEYTLEVSSPGLERKLLKSADYERFRGSLAKLQTFTPVAGNRHFTGRLTAFDGARLTLDLGAAKQNAKARKSQTAPTVEIELANVEKANLVAEI